MEWVRGVLSLLDLIFYLLVLSYAHCHFFCLILFTGEFTLRAFLNGRLDLSQAENVGKLITAKSVAVADAALAGIQECVIRI